MKEHGEMSVERRSRGYISCWTDVLLKFVAGIRLFSSALSLLAHIINVNRHVSVSKISTNIAYVHQIGPLVNCKR